MSQRTACRGWAAPAGAVLALLGALAGAGATEVHALPGAAGSTVVAAPEADDMAEKEEAKFVAALDAKIEQNRKGDATVRVLDADGKPLAGAAVTVRQTRHAFLFGCNIYRFDRYPTPAENEAYRQRFAELFNYATTGFYWKGYEPQRGRPNYEYTDRVVAWCREHDIRLKGHPLLWGHEAGMPAWSKGQPPEPVQRQRVTDIVRRYAGRIEFWEVVNEPSHCRQVKIDAPYRWARQADPNAHLIVNDYYVMANGYPPFLALLKQAQADGVPFDGIGIQAHEPRTMRFGLPGVWDVLDRYAALGKDLHITEFTPCSAGQKITGSHVRGVWDEQAQADYAVKFYKTCFAHPAVVAVTWWDLCDSGSWLKGGGMLRADLSPKPVFVALRKLIHEDWQTQVTGRTDAAGELSFRGFHGAYAVTVRAPQGALEARRSLTKGGRNRWVVQASSRKQAPAPGAATRPSLGRGRHAQRLVPLFYASLANALRKGYNTLNVGRLDQVTFCSPCRFWCVFGSFLSSQERVRVCPRETSFCVSPWAGSC